MSPPAGAGTEAAAVGSGTALARRGRAQDTRPARDYFHDSPLGPAVTDTEEQRSLWDGRRKGRARAGPARPLDTVWEEDVVFIIFSVVKPSSSFFCQHRVRSGDAEDTGGVCRAGPYGTPLGACRRGSAHPTQGGPAWGEWRYLEGQGTARPLSPGLLVARGVMGCRLDVGRNRGSRRREEAGDWSRGLGASPAHLQPAQLGDHRVPRALCATAQPIQGRF